MHTHINLIKFSFTFTNEENTIGKIKRFMLLAKGIIIPFGLFGYIHYVN